MNFNLLIAILIIIQLIASLIFFLFIKNKPHELNPDNYFVEYHPNKGYKPFYKVLDSSRSIYLGWLSSEKEAFEIISKHISSKKQILKNGRKINYSKKE